jgi:sporulation protein YlmC with PRC-barrel domain
MGRKQHDQASCRLGTLTEVRTGIPVLTSDHKPVGKVHDVVVDASNDALTRIVVNAGPHFPAPGFGAPKLVSVSPEEIEEFHHDRVQLRCSAAVFDHLPTYADWYIGGTPIGLSGGRRATAWKIPL